jgi:hypothetical protein
MLDELDKTDDNSKKKRNEIEIDQYNICHMSYFERNILISSSSSVFLVIVYVNFSDKSHICIIT